MKRNPAPGKMKKALPEVVAAENRGTSHGRGIPLLERKSRDNGATKKIIIEVELLNVRWRQRKRRKIETSQSRDRNRILIQTHERQSGTNAEVSRGGSINLKGVRANMTIVL